MKVDFTKFPVHGDRQTGYGDKADIRKDIADGEFTGTCPVFRRTCLRRRSIGTSLWSLPMTRFIYLTSTPSASVGQLADSWQDYKKTIWKLVNKKYYGKDGIK